MKRILLSVLASATLLLAGVCNTSVFAEEGRAPSKTQSTSQSTYTTAERTDDEPFAEGKGSVSVEKETPTFYYILTGVAGLIVILAIAGFITSKNKK